MSNTNSTTTMPTTIMPEELPHYDVEMDGFESYTRMLQILLIEDCVRSTLGVIIYTYIIVVNLRKRSDTRQISEVQRIVCIIAGISLLFFLQGILQFVALIGEWFHFNINRIFDTDLYIFFFVFTAMVAVARETFYVVLIAFKISEFYRINSRKAIYSAAILTIIVLEILICGVYLQSYKTENLLILEVFPHYISFVCAAAGKFFVDRQQTRQRMSLSAKKFQKKITLLILIQVFSK
ncbi:hypothetical protein WR25_12985 isoform B [Diploscapter pachys]|uniref:Uncharacterized protein n=1 Tax=Diploscapter pachys TaxID=2018661 RepID=A0A2A2LJZ7_9BILA|nr:hypothetical protein WR25_12985 isoform B [Diploscapter pachys]